MIKMKIVAVTRTGNESDIIEAFVRHHAMTVDLMLVVDDASTDGTADILAKLKAEGLPLELFHASELDWDDAAFTTELMHLAFRRFEASWVAVLDVDEFIETPPNQTLSDILPAVSTEVVGLPWANFGWEEKLGMKIVNPVLRLRTRMPLGPVAPSH